jgi:hypothetical protein
MRIHGNSITDFAGDPASLVGVWWQISRGHGIVARLPPDMDGRQALAARDPDLARRLRTEGECGDFYLRVYAPPEHRIYLGSGFDAYLRAGGGTYDRGARRLCQHARIIMERAYIENGRLKQTAACADCGAPVALPSIALPEPPLPRLQVVTDENGIPVGLAPVPVCAHKPPQECDAECDGWFISGDDGAIERCDTCGRFADDIEAALHVEQCLSEVRGIPAYRHVKKGS